MNNPHNIKVGQIVWVYAHDGRKHSSLTNKEVTSVGRKYFQIGRDKFSLEDLSEVKNYGYPDQVYLTQQERLDEEEADRLEGKIRQSFPSYGGPKFTLDQLRRIAAIIDETTTNPGDKMEGE